MTIRMRMSAVLAIGVISISATVESAKPRIDEEPDEERVDHTESSQDGGFIPVKPR